MVLLLLAAIVSMMLARWSRRSPRLWSFTGLGFAVLSLERALNFLEYAAPEGFAWLDIFHGYLGAAAYAILLAAAVDFWLLLHRAQPQ